MFKQTPKKRVLFVRTVIPVLLVVFGSISLVALNFHSPKAAAATSSYLNFQARLETSAGAIAGDGNYNVEFKIYSGASCNPTNGAGCTQEWSEDYLNSASHGIRVANGYLTANLGSITAFPSTINWDQQLWVSMNIGGTGSGSPTWDGEMFPLLQITAVPFAFQSKSAEQLTVLQGSDKGTLSFGTLTGNLDVTLPEPTGAGSTATVCYQTDTACGFLTTSSGSSFVNLQSATPGTPQAGSFNIAGVSGTGTGIAKLFQASTFDTATATTLNIGDATTPNATSISLNQDTTIAAGKDISFATGAGNFDQHLSTGTFDTGQGAVTINGAAEFKVGATIDTGSTFTNASSTLNTSDPLGDFNFTGSGNTGSIGSAAATVDTHTAFTITQITAGQTLTIPNPTGGAAGRTITIISDPASSQSFIIDGATIAPGVTASFVYNGSAWVSASSNSGVNIVGSLATGTATPSADGATIIGNTIYLQSASVNDAGLVDTLTQSFKGAKTFSDLITGQTGITVSGAAASINDNSNFATTINTGNSTGAVSIGNNTGNTAITIDSGTAAIDIGTGDQARSIHIGDGGATTAQTITIGSTSSGSTSTLTGGAYSLNVTNAGIGINTTAPSADLSFGNTANRTINILASGAGSAGKNLTIAAAASGTGAVNGGNLNLTGGASGGSGFQGLVNLSTTAFNTGVIAAYTTGPQTVATTSVDNNSAIQISSTRAAPITVTVPAPDNPATGRVLYVTVAGSNQINLTPTGGTTFLMNPGSTATLIWNVALSAWTNAGVDGGSNSYIQNQVGTTQAADFKIQGKTGNVAATIQGESGNSADILDLVGSGGGTAVAAFDKSGNLTFNQANTIKTNAGLLTLQGFGGTTINTPTASLAATSDVNIATGNETGSFASGNIFMQTGTTTAGNTGSISILSGNATGGTAGTIRIDTGTGGTTGTLQLGNTNAKIVTIGNTGNTSTGLNGNAVNITSAGDTTIKAGASNAVRIGSTQSGDTASSTTDVGNTTNATGTQSVNIGSNANVANALALDAGNSGQIQIGNTSTAHTILIGNGGTLAQSITIGSTSSTSALIFQAGSGTAGGDINIDDTTTAGKRIDIGSVDNSATSTVKIATDSGAQQTVAIGSSNSASTTTLQGGSYTLNVKDSGIGIDTTGAVGADLAFGESSSARAITVQARSTNVAGTGLTIAGGNAGTGAAAHTGGILLLVGGSADGTGNANGANVDIQGGSGVGTGVQGLVSLSTTAFATSTVSAYGSSQTVLASVIDGNSAIQISSSVTGPITVTIPAPTNNMSGRILYVTLTGSNPIVLQPTNGTAFAMNPKDTATLVWNVTTSAWTNAAQNSGSSNYIQNQSTAYQSANFKIQGVTGTVSASIQGESGGAQHILDLYSSSSTTTPVTFFDATGNLTFNQASTIKSSAGILTLQGFAGTTINTPTASAAATSDVNIATGAESGNFSSGNIFMQTGSGSGTNSSSGNISLDVGAKTGTGTAGSIKIGTGTNSPSAITIGKVGVTTTNQGNIVVGASAGSGTTFTNNGATVNTALAVANDSDGGSLGGTPGTPLTAAQSVDIYTSFTVNQTTTLQTITIPSPTNTAPGHVIYIANIGSASFTLLSATLNAGSTATLLWNGTAWTFAGADGSSILNQNSADQSANFRITGVGRANGGLLAPSLDVVSGAITIGTGATSGSAVATGITIDSAASSTIAVGASGVAHTINIGTSATAAQQIQVGSTNASSVTKIVGGSTNGVQIQSASINAFRIQDGASFTLLTADTITNKRIDIGTDASTLATTGNGDLFVKGNVESPGTIFFGVTGNGVTVDSTNHQIRLTGSAENAMTETLHPEFAGATLNGTGIGTMSASFCSNITGFVVNSAGVCATGQQHNYYSWTDTTQATAQAYSIYTRWQIPSNVDTGQTVNMVANFRGDTSSDTGVFTVYDASGNSCGTGTSTGSNAWSTVSINLSCAGLTAGSQLTLVMTLTASQNHFSYGGEVNISYKTKF